MNPIPPFACGMVLVAISTAGLSHFWSVQQFLTFYKQSIPPSEILPPAPAPATTAPENPPAPTPKTKTPPPQLAETVSPAQPDANTLVFKELLAELRAIKSERNGLVDQLAETNRDVMKLQFQVDSHSESFRPLPIPDERTETTYEISDDLPGVLPPRLDSMNESF